MLSPSVRPPEAALQSPNGTPGAPVDDPELFFQKPRADICHPKEHDLKEREQLCRAQVT